VWKKDGHKVTGKTQEYYYLYLYNIQVNDTGNYTCYDSEDVLLGYVEVYAGGTLSNYSYLL